MKCEWALCQLEMSHFTDLKTIKITYCSMTHSAKTQQKQTKNKQKVEDYVFILFTLNKMYQDFESGNYFVICLVNNANLNFKPAQCLHPSHQTEQQ